jgi:hypothetical protein
VGAPGLPAGRVGLQILRFAWQFCRPGAPTRRFRELINRLSGYIWLIVQSWKIPQSFPLPQQGRLRDALPGKA